MKFLFIIFKIHSVITRCFITCNYSLNYSNLFKTQRRLNKRKTQRFKKCLRLYVPGKFWFYINFSRKPSQIFLHFLLHSSSSYFCSLRSPSYSISDVSPFFWASNVCNFIKKNKVLEGISSKFASNGTFSIFLALKLIKHSPLNLM